MPGAPSTFSGGLALVGVRVLRGDRRRRRPDPDVRLPGGVYLAAIVGDAAALLGLRVGMRVLIRRLRRRGEDYRVWLVVGDNERSARLVKEILDHPHYGIHIDEVVDLPDRGAASRDDAPARATLGGRVVPDVEAIRAIVASRVIDEVVVTLPLRSYYDAVWRILEVCRGPVGVWSRSTVRRRRQVPLQICLVGMPGTGSLAPDPRDWAPSA